MFQKKSSYKNDLINNYLGFMRNLRWMSHFNRWEYVSGHFNQIKNVYLDFYQSLKHTSLQSCLIVYFKMPLNKFWDVYCNRSHFLAIILLETNQIPMASVVLLVGLPIMTVLKGSIFFCYSMISSYPPSICKNLMKMMPSSCTTHKWISTKRRCSSRLNVYKH